MRTLPSLSTLSLALLSASALVASGCGGGGGGGGSGSSPATLAGQVITHNGSSTGLGGLQFTLLGTGETVVSAPDGSFAFGSIPTGTIALKVSDPTAAAARVAGDTAERGDGGQDDPAGHDLGDDAADGVGDDQNDDTNGDGTDDGDNHDVGDDDCDVGGVEPGEAVEVHVSVDHGVITSLEIARTHHHEHREADHRLARTDVSDDLDATGHVETHSNDVGEMLRIEAEHLTTGRSLAAFVVQGGVDASLGTRTVTDGGRAEWVIDTSKGDTLPHGAATIADLVGDSVEVRDATTGLVLLTGTIAEPPPHVDDHDGDGHPDPGHHDGDRTLGRALLVATAGVAGEAHVAIEHRVETLETRDKLEVEVGGQVPGRTIEVWIADAGGTLTKVGQFTVGDWGHGEFERDTHDGDGLPFGVTNVADLSGRAIELRSGGAVLFSGTVPAVMNVL